MSTVCRLNVLEMFSSISWRCVRCNRVSGGVDACFVGSALCVGDGRRPGLGAGQPPERTREIRLLRPGAVVVAVVLRPGGRSQERATAVRRAAVLLRGARAVAAIREGLSRVLEIG